MASLSDSARTRDVRLHTISIPKTLDCSSTPIGRAMCAPAQHARQSNRVEAMVILHAFLCCNECHNAYYTRVRNPASEFPEARFPLTSCIRAKNMQELELERRDNRGKRIGPQANMQARFYNTWTIAAHAQQFDSLSI